MRGISPSSLPLYNDCHLTMVRTGALITPFSGSGWSPVRIGGIQGGINETSFESNGGTIDAGRLAGRCAAGAAGAKRTGNIRCDAPYGQHGRLAGDPADRCKSRSGQTEPDQDQASGRLSHLALRASAGRPPYRGRPTGRRDIRGHAQVKNLGGDRPRARRRGRRGEGVRSDPAKEDTQWRVLLEGRLPLYPRAKSRAGISGSRILL